VVELSPRGAQVDHRTRRLAFTNYLSERAGIDRDVSGLSIIGEARAANKSLTADVIFVANFLTEP
jgi:hypothetical protein